MKTLKAILIPVAFLLASCSTGLYTSSSEFDDVYYVPVKNKDVVTTVQPSSTLSPVNNNALSPDRINSGYNAQIDTAGLSDYEKYRLALENEALGEYQDDYVVEEGYFEDNYESNAPQAYDDSNKSYDSGSGNTVVNNYYYGNEYDNYDYYYSSRFRRFNRNYHVSGYYDPFYTDMFYYNYNPSYWGTSIYFGSPWNSWYSPYGYYDYYSPYSYYNSWGYPYYGSSYGGSYWSGYRHGFYDGYYGYGYSPYYYGGYYSDRNPSRNNSDYFYGHRSSRSGYSSYSSSATGTAVRKSSSTSDPRLRSRTESITADPRKAGTSVTGVDNSSRTRTLDDGNGTVRSSTGTNGVQRRVTGTNERSNSVVGNTGVQRPAGNGTVNRSPERSQPSVGTYQRSTQGTVRTAEPTGTDTYTPSYSRPRTTTTPIYNRSESSTPSTGTVKSGTTTTRPAVTPSTNYTRPSTTTTRPSSTPSPAVSTPSRSQSVTPNSSYSRPTSTPSRSSSTYSTPSSTPARSSSSYSSPSYSPSRSSSSSSGSSSGSSGSSSSSGSSGSSRSSSSGSGRR